MNIDAGFFRTACVGDYVWEDSNGNGIQDKGEVGLVGVEVELVDNNGVLAKDINNTELVVQTDAEGKYEICNVVPGEYYVQVKAPNGYYFSPKGVVDNDSIDSDIDANTKKSELFTLDSGERVDTVDAGLFKTACIGDYIWEDKNANGVQEEGEEGIAGIRVKLYKDGEEVVTDIEGNSFVNETDAKGEYKFCNIMPGDYEVRVEVPEEYYVTRKDVNITTDDKDSDLGEFLDTNKEVSMPIVSILSGEDNLTIDGGLFKSACIGSQVFLDKNGNGVYDEGDEALEGVEVTIIPVEDEYGNINYINTLKEELTSATTNSNGYYEFCNLIPGDYKIEVEPTQEQEKRKKDFALLSGSSDLIKLDSGQNDLKVYVSTADICLGDTVWYDENLNGIQDEGLEYRVKNIPVHLYMKDDSGNWVQARTIQNDLVQTVYTDTEGEYSFCGLEPTKDYKIKFDLPEGYMPITPNMTDDETKDSDADENAEIIITAADIVQHLEYQELKDDRLGDYTRDIGIYCECSDFKVHPEDYKELSAPSFNVLGLLSLLMIFLGASFYRKREL